MSVAKGIADLVKSLNRSCDTCGERGDYWDAMDNIVCEDCMELEIREGADPEDFEEIN